MSAESSVIGSVAHAAQRPSPSTSTGPIMTAGVTPSGLAPTGVSLQLFSDLHYDVRPVALPTLAPGVDVVVVAGDTSRGPQRAFDVLQRTIPEPIPIVMVAGKHEHYHGFYGETLDEARCHAPAYGITYLENDAALVTGAHFIGCTLWTDYCLDGPRRQIAALATACHGMIDHRSIGWRKQPWQRCRPDEALAMHVASRAFLNDALAQAYDGPTVVVTHLAPHPGSIHSQYAGDPSNPASANDMAALIESGRPTLWLHDHVHSSFDYHVGPTRIVCNPHGYGSENADFDPHLVVEVAR